MTDSIRATRPKGRLRSPKVKDEIRFCSHKGCETQLSRYNVRKHCYAHAPLRFPRVRGREILERPT